MAKPVEKRIVQIEATRQWIEDYGYAKKSNKVFKWYLIGWIVGLIIVGVITKNHLVVFAVFALWIASVITFFVQCSRAGKNLWKEIKDKEQPIKL